MILALLVACGSPTSTEPESAVVDADNWLRGSFVDAYVPKVDEVQVGLLNEPATTFGYGTIVDYLSEGRLSFGMYAPPIPAPDESDPFPTAPTPSLSFGEDIDLEVEEVANLSLEWAFVDEDETAIEGSFSLEFMTNEGEWLDVEGAFSGPVAH